MSDPLEHLQMPINAKGQGPETDPAQVVRVTCWACIDEDWPCKGSGL